MLGLPPLEPFLGRKLRRTSSVGKLLGGDHAGLAGSAAFVATLTKYGDTTLLFSDFISKVGRAGELSSRILALTDRSVYLLDAGTHDLRRRIALKEVSGAWLSECADNFMAVLVPSEHDCLFVCTHKSEAATALVQDTRDFAAQGADDLNIVLNNEFVCRVAADQSFRVTVEPAREGAEVRVRITAITGAAVGLEAIFDGNL